jgi:ABC-type transporter Mla subunit MlaD
MNDRTIGYTAIIILVIFLIAPVSFLVWKSVLPVQTITIKFDKINGIAFLNIQDPVYIKGVEIGQVRNVMNLEDKVYATIETRKTIRFFKNTGRQ